MKKSLPDEERPRKGGRVEGLSKEQVDHATKIGKRINSLIIEAGYKSLNKFSEAANINGEERIWPGDLGQIVSGKRSPTVKILIRIADALNIDVFQLLVVPGHSPMDDFVDKTRKATKKEMKAIVNLLDVLE